MCEDAILPRLDEWLAGLFDPAHLDATYEALTMAGVADEATTKSEIKKLVLALHDIAAVLATADPQDRAEVYAELGVSVTYDPVRRLVAVEAAPCTTERVGGPTNANFDWRVNPWSGT